jgi:hypothetical protein
VADLGGGCDGAIAPPSRKFFRFFPAKTNEKQVHTTSNASQNVFLPVIAPPFQNPRSATVRTIDSSFKMRVNYREELLEVTNISCKVTN